MNKRSVLSMRMVLVMLMASLMICATPVYADVLTGEGNTLEIEEVNVKALDKIEIVLSNTQGYDILTLWARENYDIQGEASIVNVLTVTPDKKNHQISVVLKTDPFEANKTHRLNIANIKDGAGNTYEMRTYAFYGKVDGQTSAHVSEGYAYTDTVFYGSAKDEVTMIFNNASALDLSTLKKLSNYSSNELSFYKIVAKSSTQDNTMRITLLTDRLEEAHQYHIEVRDIKMRNGLDCPTIVKSDYISSLSYDQLQNSDLKQVKESSSAYKKDTNPPKVKMIRGLTATSMEIILEDANAFDMNSLWDKNNYTIQGTVQVEEVTSVQLNQDKNRATITLRTELFKSYTSQKIKLTNISDLAGNKMTPQSYSFAPKLD